MLGFSLKEYLYGRSAVGTDFFGLANRIGFLFLAAEAVGTLDFLSMGQFRVDGLAGFERRGNHHLFDHRHHQ